MSTHHGEVWAVPYMPRDEWDRQPGSVWLEVETALREGWSGKLDDAYRLTGFTLFTPSVARMADELGAPVGQMFTVVALRHRVTR